MAVSYTHLYKQFYGEIANKKNRIKKEIEIIEKQEESTPVLNEDKHRCQMGTDRTESIRQSGHLES